MKMYALAQSAFDRMKAALFRPFNLVSWFFIAFPAWLSNLCGFGTGLEMVPNPKTLNSAIDAPQEAFAKGWDVIHLNPGISFLILLGVVLIAAAFAILILWLKSRGLFVFTDIIENGLDAERFEARWHLTKKTAESFFKVRLIYDVVAYGCLGLLFILFSLLIFVFASNAGAAFLLMFVLFIVTSLLGIFVGIVDLLYVDFGSCLMFYESGISGYEAFRSVLRFARHNIGDVLRFWGTLILINAVFGLGLFLLLLFTCCLCCVGGLFLMMPYFWAVLLLPYLYFRRAFAMECANFFRNELAFRK